MITITITIIIIIRRRRRRSLQKYLEIIPGQHSVNSLK
jgi:hypothetical protein